MNPCVMHAYPLDDYRLDLVFENGERRIFDIKPYFQRTQRVFFLVLSLLPKGTRCSKIEI
ncbi:MAG: DUF2442 domain-containing protein [Anaerolineae bacterium]|nr:DUF2442 domain-containing protein [Anaerolineae bacterium]